MAVLERLERIYDATVRPLGPLHALLRFLAWGLGGLVVGVVSRLVRFELPDDGLFPLYKLRLLLGTHEPDTVRLCRRLLRPGQTALDVGAHAGYFTLRFAEAVGPSGRVAAFEPHPGTFAVLSRNVERRDLAQVSLHQAAVSDRAGAAELWVTPLSFGHSLQRIKEQAEAVRVPTLALDGWWAGQGGGEVALVKLDVEGAEPEALAGLRAIAAASPGIVVILEHKPELLARRGGPERLRRALVELGLVEVRALLDGGGERAVDPRRPEAFSGLGKCNLLARRGAA